MQDSTGCVPASLGVRQRNTSQDITAYTHQSDTEERIRRTWRSLKRENMRTPKKKTETSNHAKV